MQARKTVISTEMSPAIEGHSGDLIGRTPSGPVAKILAETVKLFAPAASGPGRYPCRIPIEHA